MESLLATARYQLPGLIVNTVSPSEVYPTYTLRCLDLTQPPLTVLETADRAVKFYGVVLYLNRIFRITKSEKVFGCIDKMTQQSGFLKKTNRKILLPITSSMERYTILHRKINLSSFESSGRWQSKFHRRDLLEHFKCLKGYLVVHMTKMLLRTIIQFSFLEIQTPG